MTDNHNQQFATILSHSEENLMHLNADLPVHEGTTD